MGNNKSGLIILSVLVALVILGGIGLYALQINQAMGLRRDVNAAISQLSAQIEELKTQQTVGQQTSTAPSSLSDAPVADNISPTPIQSIDYTNSTYGFSLQLPTTWKGYTTKTDIKTNMVLISFGLSKWPSIFAIGVYSLAQWDKIKNNPGNEMTISSYIGQNNKYVFIASKANDYGEAQYNSLVNDFDRIIATFKAFNK